MKDLHMLVWLTHLGLSVAIPLGGFVLLALWLQSQFGWGQWTLWAGIALGALCALKGFYSSLKTLSQISKKGKDTPPAAYNEHD